MLGMDSLRRFRKRRCDSASFALLGERVTAVASEFPEGERLLPSFGQGHKAVAAQADVSTLPVNDSAQQPWLCAAGINNEVQSVSVGVAAWSLRLPNLNRRQSLVRMSSLLLQSVRQSTCPTFEPTSKLGWRWIATDVTGLNG